MQDTNPQRPTETGGARTLSQRTIELLPTGVVVAGADGTILLVNRWIETQFGFVRDELIGHPIDRLLPGGFPASPSTHDADVAAAPSIALGRRRDGSQFPVKVVLHRLTANGPSVLASITAATPPSERTRSAALEDQIDSERLVADLSVRFINLPIDRVDRVIADGLARIGDALDLDWCNCYRILADGTLVDPVSWVRPGFPSVPASVASAAFPWVLETLRAGQVVCFSSVDDIPGAADRASCRSFGIQSAVAVPLSVEGELVGAVGFNCLRAPRPWDPQTVRRLAAMAAPFGSALARQRSDATLREAFAEIERLRDQLHAENVSLRREAQDSFGPGHIVGDGAAMRRVLAQVQQVSLTDSTVLLLGETGTGKELFAAHIHELSTRRARPMVRVNCAAIPAALVESELFGREKGAYTGALARQVGRFELANRSTLFLDEIGDLPPDVQVKLLRALEEHSIERLGSPRPIQVDARIIVATHRNLERLMAEGTFREDLFYRLNVFPITVPPLRERTEDIPKLVWRFIDEFARTLGRRVDAVARESLMALQEYAWPGNIRELRNAVERAMIVATGPKLVIPVPLTTASTVRRSLKLIDVEKEHIRSVLESSGWRIRGVHGAADRLGLRPTTLETRMARLGLSRPRTR